MSTAATRRTQILDAAERLLRHYGPLKTTMAEIAREAGLGVGTVYLEFPSKDAILEELSRVRHGRVLGAMRAALACTGPCWSDRLAAVLDAKVGALLALADEGAHATDLLHCASPAVQSIYAWFREEELRLVAGLLEDATRAGEFAVDEPTPTAVTLMYAYASFAPPWVFRIPRQDLRDALGRMHGLVLHGLVRRSG